MWKLMAALVRMAGNVLSRQRDVQRETFEMIWSRGKGNGWIEESFGLCIEFNCWNEYSRSCERSDCWNCWDVLEVGPWAWL